MNRMISVKVNGKAYKSEVEPRLLLVHYLREVLNLTGTHVGCDTSQCGACTVIMNGQSVKSCTILAVQADGHEVTTVEGLATDGELHPVQQAWLDESVAQCGYCQSGQMMATVALLRQVPRPDAASSAPTGT